jgi:hypothetical protein
MVRSALLIAVLTLYRNHLSARILRMTISKFRVITIFRSPVRPCSVRAHVAAARNHLSPL